MYEDEQTINNFVGRSLEVWFEPWGMPHLLEPGESFQVKAKSAYPGQLEIVHATDNIAVYGWQGCTIQVFKLSELIDDFNSMVPNLPTDMSAKSFVDLMFKAPQAD